MLLLWLQQWSVMKSFIPDPESPVFCQQLWNKLACKLGKISLFTVFWHFCPKPFCGFLSLLTSFNMDASQSSALDSLFLFLLPSSLVSWVQFWIMDYAFQICISLNLSYQLCTHISRLDAQGTPKLNISYANYLSHKLLPGLSFPGSLPLWGYSQCLNIVLSNKCWQINCWF